MLAAFGSRTHWASLTISTAILGRPILLRPANISKPPTSWAPSMLSRYCPQTGRLRRLYRMAFRGDKTGSHCHGEISFRSKNDDAGAGVTNL